MVDERTRFLSSADAVDLGGRAPSKGSELREHELHPVRGLFAADQLHLHVSPDEVLRADNALEIERTGVHMAAFDGGFNRSMQHTR